MLLPALLGLALLFALAFVGRVGAARRVALLARWPAILFAGAAILALARGLLWPGLVLAGLACLGWWLWPSVTARGNAAPQPQSTADHEARVILGVGPSASDAEIRAAYRAKMARSHPDRGGGHAEAARLTAARDRLLRKR